MNLLLSVCFLIYLPYYVIGVVVVENSNICKSSNFFHTKFQLESVNKKYQKLSVHVNVTIPLGRNMNVKTQLFLWIKDKWVDILSFSDNDFCHYLMRTNRQVLHDIQRKSGTRIGCPVQPGYYAIDDYEINNGNMSFDILPKGKIKLSIQAFLTATKENILCIEIIARNS